MQIGKTDGAVHLLSLISHSNLTFQSMNPGAFNNWKVRLHCAHRVEYIPGIPYLFVCKTEFSHL